MDELIVLEEHDAIRVYFDERNCRVLFRFLNVFTLVAAVTAVALLADEQYLKVSLPIVNLILIRLLKYLSVRTVFTVHFRTFLISYLVLQLGIIVGLYVEPQIVHPLDFLLPLMMLFFRLPVPLLAAPLGTMWALSAGRNLIASILLPDLEPELGLLIGQAAISLAVLTIAHHLTRRMHESFVIQWRREHHRWQERQRMRGELDDARRIQLSMLPRSDPKLSWLDVAGISIPASEVGGDYYDYFKLSNERLAVVVGDVSGHGVASGILLSGVRSCLYLLQDSPLRPIDILGKLDRMVRETTGKRVFITLLYAVFDQRARSLTFAAAAHPPLLHYSARDGDVEELGMNALPLGTTLGSTIGEKTVPIHSGDIFLLYTDGIAETTDSRGDVYGAERLGLRLQQTPHDRSAREIRDTLLGDVWAFKGDGIQTDDITLVVVRAR